MVLCIEGTRHCSLGYSRSVYLETIAVEYCICRVVASLRVCVSSSYVSSSCVCLGWSLWRSLSRYQYDVRHEGNC